MAKISEDDLRQLFKEDESFITEEKKSEEKKSKPVKVIKSLEKVDHIGLVRKKIREIKQPIPQKKVSIFSIPTFILKILFIWGIAGFLLFTLIEAPALINRLKWSYYVDYLNQKLPKEKNMVKLPDYSNQEDKKVALPENLPRFESVENNIISIPKISVKAPIIWDTPEEEILDKLTGGVAHYKGTNHPGEGGNIFLVGHSSNYFWVSSDYNTIFSLLDKLERGDRVEITYNNKKYFYDVEDKKVVNPEEVGVLQNTPKETLTLMTCWPVGTSLDRLIVQASLVYSSY